MTHDVDEPICLDCVLTNVIGDMLDNGRPIAKVWEVVKDAIEEWEQEA